MGVFGAVFVLLALCWGLGCCSSIGFDVGGRYIYIPGNECCVVGFTKNIYCSRLPFVLSYPA